MENLKQSVSTLLNSDIRIRDVIEACQKFTSLEGSLELNWGSYLAHLAGLKESEDYVSILLEHLSLSFGTLLEIATFRIDQIAIRKTMVHRWRGLLFRF